MTEILVRIVLVFFALAPVATNFGFRCSPKHSLWHLHLRGGEHVGLSPTAKDGRGECGGGTPIDFNYESLFDGCHLAHCMIRVRNNTEMESFLRDEMHMQLLRKETFERFSRMAVTMNSVDSNIDPCAAAAGDAPMTWGVSDAQIRKGKYNAASSAWSFGKAPEPEMCEQLEAVARNFKVHAWPVGSAGTDKVPAGWCKSMWGYARAERHFALQVLSTQPARAWKHDHKLTLLSLLPCTPDLQHTSTSSSLLKTRDVGPEVTGERVGGDHRHRKRDSERANERATDTPTERLMSGPEGLKVQVLDTHGASSWGWGGGTGGSACHGPHTAHCKEEDPFEGLTLQVGNLETSLV